MSRPPRGMASVGMVMLLLAMGLLLVNGVAQWLAQQIPSLRLVREAVVALSDVQSLEAAARQRRWLTGETAPDWQCQNVETPAGRACLQRLKDGRYLLGVRLAGQRPAPVVWRWVRPGPQSLRAEPMGWIDLCPPQAMACELQ